MLSKNLHLFQVITIVDNPNLAVKGRSHLLIKKRSNKIRRDGEENKSSNEENKDTESEEKIQHLKDQILELSEKLERSNKNNQNQDKYADLLNDLYHKGIIDDEGKFLE